MASHSLDRREEYSSVARKIRRIGCAFGVVINDEKEREMHDIVRASEIIDRFNDPIQDENERKAFQGKILTALRESSSEGFESELLTAIQDLNQILLKYPDQKEAFIKRVEDLFHHSEVIRTSRSIHMAIEHIISEGKGIVDLYMSFLEDKPETFVQFAREAGVTANVVDDLLDAKKDLENGERTYELDGDFYLILSQRAISGMIKLITMYPVKTEALKLTFKGLQAARKASRLPEPKKQII